MFALAVFALPLVAVFACGGSITVAEPVEQPDGSSSGGSGSSGEASSSGGGSSSGGASSSGAVGRIPKVHRAVAEACDGVRFDAPSTAPDAGTEQGVSCHSHEDCTEGRNGRCTGNGHDGWQCTYDRCTADVDCGANAVCECKGGFRSDHDVCLQSDCQVDADCGVNGYCSPSLGACGRFSKYVTYACHQPADECIDDEDCAGASNGTCRFEPSVGHWKCSDSECAG